MTFRRKRRCHSAKGGQGPLRPARPCPPPRRPRTPLRSLPPGGAHGERPGRVRGARRPFQPQQPAVTRTQARATGSEPDVASCGDISDPGRVPRHRACPEPAPRQALSPTSAARAQGESQLLSWDPRWQAGPGSPRAGALCEPCTRCEPSPHSLCGPGHHTPKSPACVNVRRGLPQWDPGRADAFLLELPAVTCVLGTCALP